MNPRVFLSAAVIGTLTALDDYLYGYGVAKLPVSTSSLIIATQLAFTAGFAYFLVKQKFTAYSINAVVLLTVGDGGFGASHERRQAGGGVEQGVYVGVFFDAGGGGAVRADSAIGELMYMKAKQGLTYTLVMEIQLVMCFFATAFCTVGMIINKDFQAIAREAKAYELGETKYYVIVVWSEIIWQCFFLGTIGVIFYSLSLLSGIISLFYSQLQSY
ncbi:hypothetical protein BUALT_Bualt07G0141400 [Buddleja alternifolia]|uniref:Silicon transporter n=1 Tax=Buddleja alternifolia TaxID=168488 RepID=A0AAV6W046_9LAMI|nr:hypothetical protein BUALT_BualtUnG0058100 [Buddleja alternifolia]KAG8379935.1 hypothetical protein BUALT_Bualt07G0141400 [Buddleja alternifolia]